VHARFRILRIHVEPDASSHGKETVLVDQVWILKKVKFTVVLAGSEDIRERSIVVIPRELEGSAAVVLSFALRWPRIVCPSSLLIVAGRISIGIETVAANLLHPVQCLRPEGPILRSSLASFLAPVGEDGRKLPPACVVKCLATNCGLTAELGELGHSLQEVVVGVDGIRQWEPSIPFGRRNYSLHSLHVLHAVINAGDITVISHSSFDSPFDFGVVRVRDTVSDTEVIFGIIPVIASPEPIGSDGRVRHLL